MTQPRLMVSNPVSGFGIYIPNEVVSLLGGCDTPLYVNYKEHVNGGLVFRIRTAPANKGRLHIRKLNRSTYPARIFWNSSVKTPVKFNFRPVYCEWEFDVPSKTLRFTLPKRGALQSATTNSKLKPKRPLLDLSPEQPDPIIGMAAAFKQMADAFSDLLEQLKRGPQ